MQGLDERSQDIIRARWLDETTSPRCRNWLTVTAFPLNVTPAGKERDEKTARCYRSVISLLSREPWMRVRGFCFLSLYIINFPSGKTPIPTQIVNKLSNSYSNIIKIGYVLAEYAAKAG